MSPWHVPAICTGDPVRYGQFNLGWITRVILAYPRFDRPFEVYTDASTIQLGAVIVQSGRPIAFFSRKLSSAQRKYTTRELELLSIVETLNEFRNTIFGYKVIVYTDHKNLTFETTLMLSERVMRWRLLLEEFGVTFKYIEGTKNVIADMLSRHPTRKPTTNIVEPQVFCLTA